MFQKQRMFPKYVHAYVEQLCILIGKASYFHGRLVYLYMKVIFYIEKDVSHDKTHVFTRSYFSLESCTCILQETYLIN